MRLRMREPWLSGRDASRVWLGTNSSAAAMRLNQNTVLLGKKVALVPYTAMHVPRYHEWMKSEELQRLTSSEPLTLEQEYAMQYSWQEDADKCTFIVLDAKKWQAQPHPTEESCMVGDVNLFLMDLEDPALGEIEVMIAEPSYRGQGFGTEAALLMMSYGMTKLGLTKFEAKIGQENKPSIRMFQKLHFKQVAASNVFQEVTLRLAVSEPERLWLLEQTSHMEEKPYRAELVEPVTATQYEKESWHHPLAKPELGMGSKRPVPSVHSTAS
ncbi:N-acetyltransferase 9 isoform X3 [Nannospalax galili]|uniref:N-acetyltransferase 9 isoform X3 n=1 Tax=Nannospalax galili TaxID=1026970 RepID=UPI00111C5CB9|nr:N-acetyltransferase 9 isoform X3 [Nannospalax galili]